MELQKLIEENQLEGTSLQCNKRLKDAS